MTKSEITLCEVLL